MLRLADLRDAISNSTAFLDNDLIVEVLALAGYQTSEHSRFWRRLAMRRNGIGGWVGVPDFGKFDDAHRFLLDKDTRVQNLFETMTTASSPLKDGRWCCTLQHYTLTYKGSGTGISAGHALTAAWVDLQLNRSRR